MKKKVTIQEGETVSLPVSIIEKSIPSPKPSRAQIVEALVEIRLQQYNKEVGEWAREEDRLRDIAKEEIVKSILRQKPANVAGSIPARWRHDDREIGTASITVEGRNLSKEAQNAINTYHDKCLDPKKPELYGYSDDERRKTARKEILAKMELKAGSNRNRLVALLDDKTTRTAFENMLAALDGKQIVESEAIAA